MNTLPIPNDPNYDYFMDNRPPSRRRKSDGEWEEWNEILHSWQVVWDESHDDMEYWE